MDQYILPWEDGFIVTITKPLAIKRLLPYLGAWDVGTDVNGINFLIDEVNAGKTIHYDFNSAEEKTADPSKEATGLLFIEGDPGALFALVLAGGGFTSVAMIQEAFPIGDALHKQGYNVFMLKYRVGEHEGDVGKADMIKRANQDTAAALAYIFENADHFHINTEGYSVWGFSAGGRLALLLGSDTEFGYASYELPAPSALIMGYPGVSDMSADVHIPTFIVMCKDDELVPVASVEEYVRELEASGTMVDFHEYKTGRHGFGIGIGTDANGWINAALDFWKKYQK
jgi:acetyl esterase/lipase